MATQIVQSSIVAKRLEGKVAVITGGDQGIGSAIASRLAAEGADIAFCYRSNRTGAEEVVASITNGTAAVGTGRRVLITVNNIEPGAIETPINKALLNDPAKLKAVLDNIPLKRLGEPDDVSGAAAFLASADADYITGTTLLVDGGLLWSHEEQ